MSVDGRHQRFRAGGLAVPGAHPGWRLTRLHPVTFMDSDVLALRNHVFAGLVAAFYDNDAHALVLSAELDDTVDFGYNRLLLRTAGFKEFGNPRQNAGYVLGLFGLPRHL